MSTLLTALFLLALASAVGMKILLANRRAAREAAARAAAARERAEKERALRERVTEAKGRGDLRRAASAIAEDPGRAARVVAKMMRSKD